MARGSTRMRQVRQAIYRLLDYMLTEADAGAWTEETASQYVRDLAAVAAEDWRKERHVRCDCGATAVIGDSGNVWCARCYHDATGA